MNVNDFNNTAPTDEDLLKVIFRRQAELMIKYHKIEEINLGRELPEGILDLDDPRAQERIKDFAWRITEEIGEAANCLKNKPWKTSHMPTDKVHFNEEMIDAFHFFIELLIMCGFTPESLVAMYMDKNDVNHFRIRSKY